MRFFYCLRHENYISRNFLEKYGIMQMSTGKQNYVDYIMEKLFGF